MESVGFRAVPAPDLIGGCVAVYAKAGVPTHVAKRLPDGRWSGKLGGNVLVTHATPYGVEGPLYGDVVRYLPPLSDRVR